MGTNAAASRAQGTTGTWVKDAVTYDDWTWGSTCTNTLWGVVPADANTKAVTLTAPTPKCTNVKTTSLQTLTIPMTQDLTAKDYSTMTIKFTIDVKMPTNRLGKTTDVIAMFYDANSYQMLGVAAKQSILAVTKPAGDALAANAAKGLVAFGTDPVAPLETAKGTGIYSPPYCLTGNKKDASVGGYGEGLNGNCGFETAIDAVVGAKGVPTREMQLVNSLEISWTLPYAIPDDRTEGVVTCATEWENASANDNDKKYDQDPLRIFQSSMMAKGWGKGNCFYEGVAAAAPANHIFRCTNLGALASGAALQLGFQFAISNHGKSYKWGDKADAKLNVVVPLAKTLTCTLVISSYTSATTSTTEWYKNAWKATVDGDTTNNAVKFSTFIGAPVAYPSLGQKAAAATYTQEKKDVATNVWFFMSANDRGTAVTNMRLFPFDTTASGNSGKTTASLHIRNYGSGLKSAATFTAVITQALYDKAKNSLYGGAGTFKFEFGADSTAAKLDSDTKTGYLSMTYLKEKWGGTCCAAYKDCKNTKGLKKAGGDNDVAARYACDATTGNLLMFATANDGNMGQGYYNDAAAKNQLNSLMSLQFDKAMDMPTATLTAVRGKGGFASTQNLVDVFFQMMVGTSGNAIQTLMHFYVEPKTATKQSLFNVVYGYPSNVYTATYSKDHLTYNDGASVLSTGLKLYFTKATKVIADYYGFYVPRMIPFYTSNGGNEIETRVNSARKVQCWNWGSYNGAGFAQVKAEMDKNFALYFGTNHAVYLPTRQFAGLNMVICKVTKDTAASSAAGYTGDVVVIPATQTAADNTKTNAGLKYKSHDPLPGVASADPLPTTLKGLLAACKNGESKMTILGGADQYLGALSHIAGSELSKFKDIAQAEEVAGTPSKTPFPAGFTANNAKRVNDNTNGLFDILNAAGTTSTVWLIGAKAMEAKIEFAMPTAADWSKAVGQLVICAPRAGILASSLEMRGGTKTGEFCTAAFEYDVGQQDINVVSGYENRGQRYCRWCSATFSTDRVIVWIKDFVPATTSSRKLKGISLWGSATGASVGQQFITLDTYATKTTQYPTKIKSGDCGKDSQALKKGTKGQVAEFTLKNAVPLAAE